MARKKTVRVRKKRKKVICPECGKETTAHWLAETGVCEKCTYRSPKTKKWRRDKERALDKDKG